jgi:hypothetical protein
MAMATTKTVITSANYPHYIGFGDLGWLWVQSYDRAHVFASRAEAEAFVAMHLPGMVTDVWYLRG